MSKQDRQGVRTAADLERKYNFGSIDKEKSGDSSLYQKLNQSLNDLKAEVSNKFDNIQEDIDKCYEKSEVDTMIDEIEEKINSMKDVQIEGITNAEIDSICV